MSDSDNNTTSPLELSTSSQRLTKYTKKTIPTRELIELVREQPCLWDRKIPEYRDKMAKDMAWYHIYKNFEPDFDTFDQAKKNFVGNTITNKWHNARDSYVKSRKVEYRGKPYLYSEYLRFLDETIGTKKQRKDLSYIEEVDADEIENDDSQSWMKGEFVNIDENEVIENVAKRTRLDYEASTSGNSKETTKDECDDNIVSVLVNLIQKEEDEDRAFFKSITPSVKTLSERSKFEFRIQVMKLISSLKKKDKSGVRVKRQRSSTNDDSD